MPKRKEFDLMKYVPLVLIAFAGAGAWFNLNSSNAGQDKSIDKLEAQVEKQSQDYSNINVAQVQLQSKVDQSFTILQDIKDSLKEIRTEKNK